MTNSIETCVVVGGEREANRTGPCWPPRRVFLPPLVSDLFLATRVSSVLGLGNSPILFLNKNTPLPSKRLLVRSSVSPRPGKGLLLYILNRRSLVSRLGSIAGPKTSSGLDNLFFHRIRLMNFVSLFLE